MMKTTIILAFFLCIATISSLAQGNLNSVTTNSEQLKEQTISILFDHIPDDVLFGLLDEQKTLLSSMSSDSTAVTTKNIFGGEIKRLSISDSYVSLQTSEIGTLQIKILPMINDSKVLCVVKTVCGQNKVCDSKVKFYTTAWKPISQLDLKPKAGIEWFLKDNIDCNSQDFKNAFSIIDIYPIQFDLSAESNDITAQLDIKNYLPEQEYKKIQPYLSEQKKTLVWDKVSYK